ncbi:hypothetical protein B0T22DRAFT_438597 [Podospora appendiculata]|uniref:Uncharacterized protein n=1 Tax=Podospora appendiculata TaxID=314037 RepID=A0AAE0XLI2_9PEZI|nr:hypothetical protein B0T22DRAFT_438597 [Podospora appendiculata]
MATEVYHSQSDFDSDEDDENCLLTSVIPREDRGGDRAGQNDAIRKISPWEDNRDWIRNLNLNMMKDEENLDEDMDDFDDSEECDSFERDTAWEYGNIEKEKNGYGIRPQTPASRRSTDYNSSAYFSQKTPHMPMARRDKLSRAHLRFNAPSRGSKHPVFRNGCVSQSTTNPVALHPSSRVADTTPEVDYRPEKHMEGQTVEKCEGTNHREMEKEELPVEHDDPEDENEEMYFSTSEENDEKAADEVQKGGSVKDDIRVHDDKRGDGEGGLPYFCYHER